MTDHAPNDRAAARSLESFTVGIEDVAARHGTTRAEILKAVIEGLEKRIAEDTALLTVLRRLEDRIAEDTEILALARRLEDLDRMPAETAIDTAIDIVARGEGQRPWRGI